ncbi:hypothetical protein SAMN04487949_1556 [Halogranum gelatinilyticum]|uniref:Uncharacterized protein n=1 Tax=Halogranum gelatinilyticum TaxID=660521 RepID=A0A1G9SZ17_9EURY|nr:hypothetical protein [Halogranum gelatinilyticum]SDM40693.1 hypothetical protein SAMN04487949_1556 [Halogranum gelatinilyticum]
MTELPAVRKIDVLAYLLVLFGLNFVTEYGLKILTDGPTVPTLAGLVFALTVVAGGLYARVDPEFETTTEPAPWYLYVVAGIGTVAFLSLLVLRVRNL